MKEDGFAFNHHPLQKGIWFPYNGWRYKVKYDVKLYNGDVFMACYPNGDSFMSSQDTKPRVKDEEVEFVRLTDNSLLGRYDNRLSTPVGLEHEISKWHPDQIPDVVTDEEGNQTFIPKPWKREPIE